MSQDKKSTLVLIPGSFLPSTHYIPLLAHLPPGTKSHILDPPSYHTKRPGAPPTMADDASFVASFLSQLADAGEEVVLVAHSYGGMPASECLRGLSTESRANEGKRGGVRRLGYVTAVVPKEGEGLRETMVGGVQVPLEVDEVGFLSLLFFLACTGKIGMGRFRELALGCEETKVYVLMSYSGWLALPPRPSRHPIRMLQYHGSRSRRTRHGCTRPTQQRGLRQHTHLPGLQRRPCELVSVRARPVRDPRRAGGGYPRYRGEL